MKTTKFFSLISLILIITGSCEVEPVQRYFEVNGTKADINYAYMDTWGTSEDLSSRWYAISFRSHDIDPSDYITFLLGSYTNETDIIAEGTYDYDYLGGKGLISDVIVGYNIEYDYLGLPTGNRIDDDLAVFSGSISVEREGGRYVFIFDLQADYNNEVFYIQGEYNGNMILNANVVDLDSY